MEKGDFMIKVKDFAASKGVTDKAIYKHLAKHKEALEGHVEKRGKNGTWMDEYACAYITNLMIVNPIVVGEASQQAEIEKLKAEIDRLKNDLIVSEREGKLISQAMLNLKDEMGKLQLENKELHHQLELKAPKKKRKWFWQNED